MIERVRSFVDTYQLNNVETELLVAVSGGMDSMVLIDLLKELNCTFSIAHMNYGLRGKDSEKDEAFVMEFAGKHKIQVHVQHADMTDLHGESIQMVARTKRYEWFHELAAEHKYDFVLTAHHLNDSLETTLLNLTKGTGIKGLTGISSQNGKTLRPLVNCTKDELKQYADKNGLQWREDASNAESKYLRNKIRNQVIPVLKEINPSLLETFRNTNERLMGVSELLEKEVAQLTQSHQKLVNGIIELDLSWHERRSMHDVLLAELLKPYGVSYVQSKEIGRTRTSGAIFYTDDYQLNIDREKLLISKRLESQTNPLNIGGIGTYEWGDRVISLDISDDINFTKDEPNTACFDLAQITFPITIRSWEEGDIFIPLGMSGKKKVSDFMIDNKIPLTLKKSIPLFVSGEDICWVGGYRIDNSFKLTKQTKEVLKIKITRRD